MGLNVDVEAFERDGAVRVRGLASTGEVAELAAAIDEHLRHPSPLAVVASSPDDPGRFLEDFCNWQRIPAYLTLHRSAGSPTRRRVLSFRFLGDDCCHAVRPWRTSPPFPGLTDDLPNGAPFNHPLFPILWNRTPAA